MGDVPIRPDPEPTEADLRRAEFAAKLSDLRDRLDDGTRVTLTGEHAASIRRPALFVALGLALVLGLPALGIVALLALALTDQVVAL